MIEQICNASDCTACGACKTVCPVHCISMHINEYGIVFPVIDHNKCMECKRCINTCPNNNAVIAHPPIKCYVGWSFDNETRQTSASGGIASEIYKYCASNHITSVGCELVGSSDCHLKVIRPGEEIKKFRNSKYVYSSTDDTYKELVSLIRKGEKVIFIGLPCQVAGLKNCLSREYENLTTIDIVCHGVAPQEYLKQHIENRIESRKNLNNLDIKFRNPELAGGTASYWFTISKVGESVEYAKKVYDNDEYQYGYHKALIYRDNCYRCRYAKGKRVGDLTISDFSGLGKIIPWNKEKTNVSCILVNTDKGAILLDSLKDRIYIEERPLDEALKYEHQLSQPSIPHPKRDVFIANYSKTHNFDRSVRGAVGNILMKNHLKETMRITDIRNYIAGIIPTDLKRVIRRKIL